MWFRANLKVGSGPRIGHKIGAVGTSRKVSDPRSDPTLNHTFLDECKQ